MSQTFMHIWHNNLIIAALMEQEREQKNKMRGKQQANIIENNNRKYNIVVWKR